MRIADVIGRPRDWVRALTAATGIGVFLGLIGPFGTYLAGDAGHRIAYWTVLFWVGTAVLLPASRAAAMVGPRLGYPLPFAIAVALIVASLPISLAATLVGQRLWPQSRVLGPVDWYLQTLIVAIPVTAALVWLERRSTARLGAGPPNNRGAVTAGGASRDDFLTRLPEKLGRELLCLEVEDHYVRAHTVLGSDLILIPLHQAIGELRGIDGLQVHRSWWVARAAVTAWVADGRNIRLRLLNGTHAPVARNRVAKLREAAWLPRDFDDF